jgi:hypothetical protein
VKDFISHYLFVFVCLFIYLLGVNASYILSQKQIISQIITVTYISMVSHLKPLVLINLGLLSVGLIYSSQLLSLGFLP